MFERFTPAARQVIVRAQEEARTLGHPWLGTEHLLLGVLAQPQTPRVSVMTDLGVTLGTGRAALSLLIGRAGLGERDADALRTLGIDLDEVRRRAEARFGPGALDRPPRQRTRRLMRRRRGHPSRSVDAQRAQQHPAAPMVFVTPGGWSTWVDSRQGVNVR